MPGRWETSTMPGNISIFSSVGRNGTNLFGDVTIIQQLINLKIPIPQRPLAPSLSMDSAGRQQYLAIEKVQRHDLLMTQPTGKVEPDDPTFNFLTRGITAEALGSQQIAWGAKVSAAFKARLIEIAQNIAVDPNYLISAIAFETGETFSPSIKNRQRSDRPDSIPAGHSH